MSQTIFKVKKQRRTSELLLSELESLYCLLRIAPDKNKVQKLIKEREKILQKRGIEFSTLKEN